MLWPTRSQQHIRKLIDRYVNEHGRNCEYCGDPWTYIVKEHSRFKGHNTPRGSTNIKRNEYENLYDCIRTDQVPADHVAYWFSDEKFFNWYKKQRDRKASWEK